MTDTPERSNEEQWPAVEVAYDFVMPSHQMMTVRGEAVATRVQALMTFGATITLGIPVLGRAVNDKIDFFSEYFGLALGLFAIFTIMGIFARDFGDFMVVHPTKLYDTSLHLSTWEFKRNAIFYAGQCFEHNRSLINRKATIGRLMSAVLLLEVLCFLIWIAGA